MWRDVDVLMVISAVFFMIVFLVPDNNRLLTNALGDFLGKVSFSLYLLHLPVLHFFEPSAKLAPYAYFSWYLLSALFVAYLSYAYLECPSRALVRKLPAKLPRYFQGSDSSRAMINHQVDPEAAAQIELSKSS